jgi:hypothetical protein
MSFLECEIPSLAAKMTRISMLWETFSTFFFVIKLCNRVFQQAAAGFETPQQSHSEMLCIHPSPGKEIKNPLPVSSLPHRAPLLVRRRQNSCVLFVYRDVLGPRHAHKSRGRAGTTAPLPYTSPVRTARSYNSRLLMAEASFQLGGILFASHPSE